MSETNETNNVKLVVLDSNGNHFCDVWLSEEEIDKLQQIATRDNTDIEQVVVNALDALITDDEVTE